MYMRAGPKVVDITAAVHKNRFNDKLYSASKTSSIKTHLVDSCIRFVPLIWGPLYRFPYVLS